MSENAVTLSQSEIDKLLGKDSGHLKKALSVDDVRVERTEVKNILSEKGLKAVHTIMDSAVEEFCLDLTNKFSDTKARKVSVTKVELINAADFEAEIIYPAFIFKLECKGAFVFVKLDPFLFCALTGIPFDGRIKPNLFQHTVLKNEIMPLLINSILNCFGAGISRESIKISMVDSKDFKDLPEIKANETGVLTIINWNESFKSFGVEKIYLSQEMLGLIKKTNLLNE